jgi:Holliday junction resolvase RusA-like endonuclease
MKIEVVGLPAPKGSKKAFVVKGRAIVTDVSNKSSRDRLNPWKLAVTAAVQRALADAGNPPPLDGALSVNLSFRLPRPASTPKHVKYPTKKPDLDKLARAALDLCNQIVWSDDARITTLVLSKRFAEGAPPGMTLTVITVTLEHP